MFGTSFGNLKLVDLENRITFASFPLKNKITSIEFIESLNIALIGFSDGSLQSFEIYIDHTQFKELKSEKQLSKIYTIDSKESQDEFGFAQSIIYNKNTINKFQLFKVFSVAIESITISQNLQFVSLLSTNNELFIFEMNIFEKKNKILSPFFMIKISEKIENLKFLETSSRLYFSLISGKVISIRIPGKEEINNKKSYLIDLNDPKLDIKYSQISMMTFQKPKQDENDLFYVLNGSSNQENIEWKPDSITSFTYIPCQSNLFSLFNEAKQEFEKIEQQEKQLIDSESKNNNTNVIQNKALNDKFHIEQNEDIDKYDLDNLLLVTSQGKYLGYIYLIKLRDWSDSSFLKTNGKYIFLF